MDTVVRASAARRVEALMPYSFGATAASAAMSWCPRATDAGSVLATTSRSLGSSISR